MEFRRITNKLEGLHYTPTALQKAMGEPLRSEQRTGELLPGILSRVDMFVIFIAIVLFIPNVSTVQVSRGAGTTTYVYWVLGTLTFLIPGAVVTGQLNRFMPADGGIYVWTHRAMGPLWGFFAAFCAWFPGVLVLLAASDSILSLLQGIGTQIAGPNANWLVQPWQQGIIVLCAILVGGLVRDAATALAPENGDRCDYPLRTGYSHRWAGWYPLVIQRTSFTNSAGCQSIRLSYSSFCPLWSDRAGLARYRSAFQYGCRDKTSQHTFTFLALGVTCRADRLSAWQLRRHGGRTSKCGQFHLLNVDGSRHGFWRSSRNCRRRHLHCLLSHRCRHV
jgi:hypothetical protein